MVRTITETYLLLGSLVANGQLLRATKISPYKLNALKPAMYPRRCRSVLVSVGALEITGPFSNNGAGCYVLDRQPLTPVRSREMGARRRDLDLFRKLKSGDNVLQHDLACLNQICIRSSQLALNIRLILQELS